MHKPYYALNKNSQTLVVFIHGILESPNQFNDLMTVLDDNISVVNILLPGHGGSGKDFAKSSMSQYKSHLHDILSPLINQYESVILVGHSMGTLLAIDYATTYPKHIKSLFLLAVPTRIRLTQKGAINSLKVGFNLTNSNDVILTAAKQAYSIEPSSLLTYLTWAPRYVELFIESYQTRTRLKMLTHPHYIFQSTHDEFVHPRSTRDFQNEDHVTLLKDSGHFYYAPHDRQHILQTFKAFIAKPSN